MPIYNVEKYLRKCLDSVCGQTYKNLEIVLVNDCSPDNSYDICVEYAGKDDRIKIINKEKNEGLGCARMSGIKAASGYYIGFVDPDDWIAPRMYEDLMKIMEENNADIIQCKYFLAYDDKIMQTKDTNTIKRYNNIEAVKDFLYLISFEPFFWNKIFKKDLYNVVSISEPRFGEDTSTMYKLLFTAESVIYYDKSYYYYLQRPDSMMYETPNIQKCKLMISIEKNRIKYFEENCPELIIISKQKFFTKYASIYLSLENNSHENRQFLNEISDEMHKLYREIKNSLSFKRRCMCFILLIASKRNIVSKCLYFVMRAILKRKSFRYDIISRSWKEIT